MRIRLHRASAAATAVAVACAVVAVCPINASADVTSTVGWVRLAQLSPAAAPADLYLSPADNSGAQSAKPVLAHAAYGTLSQYQPVSPGGYTVAMRPAGAAATADPVAGTQITVAAGQAYTVAAVGTASPVKLSVLTDQLGTPQGQAGVRVIEASRLHPTASVLDGVDTLATNLRAPDATQYQPVTAGTGALLVTTAAVTQTVTADLAANSAYTVVVLDGSQDAARVLVVTDASGISAMPKGGVSTGFGGTAVKSTAGGGMAGHGYLAPAIGLSLSASLLVLTAVTRFRRRRARRRAAQ